MAVSDPSLSTQYGGDVRPLPGDDLIPDAGVVLDRAAEFACSAEVLWPWIVQLGKDRAGWHLPDWLERLVRRRRSGCACGPVRWAAASPGSSLSVRISSTGRPSG